MLFYKGMCVWVYLPWHSPIMWGKMVSSGLVGDRAMKRSIKMSAI